MTCQAQVFQNGRATFRIWLDMIDLHVHDNIKPCMAVLAPASRPLDHLGSEDVWYVDHYFALLMTADKS